MQTQREAQQANKLSNLTRQRQLRVSVNYRRVIIEELERLSGNLVAYKMREYLKRIQKAVLVEVIELKKELRLQGHLNSRDDPIPEITTTTQTLFSSQNNQVDNCVVKPIRIIPGPTGIVQTAKLCKLVDTQEGGEESVMSTQKYIRKVIEDVGEDDDFTRASWLSAIDYVNIDGGIMTGCFGDVKKFLKNGKLEKVVAVIKSCTTNLLGNLTVTLKDLSGTISGIIHYKVLIEDRFAKAITVGAALILHNVSVISPKQSTHHYLNITKKNMVKVFHKDGGSAISWYACSEYCKEYVDFVMSY
ncbi:hypothetical protein Tco_1431078 [Tanacetum coccineum]